MLDRAKSLHLKWFKSLSPGFIDITKTKASVPRGATGSEFDVMEVKDDVVSESAASLTDSGFLFSL